MKNFYYSFELNLENVHVQEHFANKLNEIVNDDTVEFSMFSRFFTSSEACLEAVQTDLNAKIVMLKVGKSKDPITSINETNPVYSNTPESLEEIKKDNPNFDEYLETWGDNEIVRLTYTTEEFNEEEPPIPVDEHAMLFRYVMHELEDDLLIPDGSHYVENSSSMVH